MKSCQRGHKLGILVPSVKKFIKEVIEERKNKCNICSDAKAQANTYRVHGRVDVAEVVGEVPQRLGDPFFQL